VIILWTGPVVLEVSSTMVDEVGEVGVVEVTSGVEICQIQ
jgi:hypothetical protein